MMGLDSATATSLNRSANTVVFGACSGIAEAWMSLRASKGDRLFLIARDADRLNVVASHLRIKYAIEVECWVLDSVDIDAQEQVIESVFARVAANGQGGVSRVFIAIGLLGSETDRFDWQEAKSILEVNFTSMVSLISKIVPRLIAQGSGTLLCLSSVAGERGRANNLVYGAAKSGLTAYLSGLRNMLSDTHIRIITVKPGPVDTAMTAGLKKSIMFATPERVACDIDRAESKRQLVVYTPSWWRWIMLVIRCLPERVFMRLRF